jgi:hypothetical protein
MNFLPDGLTTALYAVVALGGSTILVLWLASNRTRRNAGFASKGQLKRQLSAKAALRASEIRPSLAAEGSAAQSRPAMASSKRPRSRAS